MPRPTWKGYLKLSLVSCAVALYNATSASERVSFNTLNRKTGNRLKQLMIDSGTQEPVDPTDRVKGYEVSKGQYLMVEDQDLEALKIESTRTIDIDSFVPQAEVDQIYLDNAYYLAPTTRWRRRPSRSSATPWRPGRSWGSAASCSAGASAC